MAQDEELCFHQRKWHTDGLVQDCSNSSANALGLPQSCTKHYHENLIGQFIRWLMKQGLSCWRRNSWLVANIFDVLTMQWRQFSRRGDIYLKYSRVPFRTPPVSACRRYFCPPKLTKSIIYFIQILLGSNFEFQTAHPYEFYTPPPPPPPPPPPHCPRQRASYYWCIAPKSVLVRSWDLDRSYFRVFPMTQSGASAKITCPQPSWLTSGSPFSYIKVTCSMSGTTRESDIWTVSAGWSPSVLDIVTRKEL